MEYYGTAMSASQLLEFEMQVKEEPVDIDHHLWGYSPQDGRGDENE